VSASRLKNELQRRVEVAASAGGPRNGDHTVAQRLAQGLDTGIQHHAISTARVLDASQDLIVAVGDRVRDLNHRAGVGIPQDNPQKYGALSGRRGRTAVGGLGLSVGVEPGYKGRGNEQGLTVRYLHRGRHDLRKVVRRNGHGGATKYVVAVHRERIADIRKAAARTAYRCADRRRGLRTRVLSKGQTRHQNCKHHGS
jgi:hypothetical protein